MAMKRDVIDALGGFDTGLGPGAKAGVGEDLDFLYRALRSGFKIVYSPDVHVFHGHGRQAKTVVDRVRKNYIAGRGGFYWKHIRSGDRYVAKLAFWEIHGTLRRAWRAGVDGGSIGEELSVLGSLLKGAVAFAWHRRRNDFT